MSTNSICNKCIHRWSSGGKLYCTYSYIGNCQYSKIKKECNFFEEGRNDKYWRGKQGKNRKGKAW